MEFGPIFSHTAYLLNLSTTDDVLLEKTVIALADEIVRGGMLGVDGVVTHVGNDPDHDERAAARRAASVVLGAYELAGEIGSDVRLLLENTAGAGASFGCTFGQLASIIDVTGLPSERLGVCFDTCHAFAFGMPLHTVAGWAGVIAEIDGSVGLDRLGLIHANDALFERASRRDRHAWIGDGFIGEEGFSAMLCAAELRHVPAVTEMPGEKPYKDEVNLQRLKDLRAACAPSQ
jgi:deoxyribonuclease-4